ncbi:DUF433 domain-containing protein [Spirulina major CS-329]|nr:MULTISPECIES: DUF433 domain-containing protein [Spirulina]MDB9493264.1 DUF433 domain-containing protein [Spirulina subsalsa CS-330]MDB9505301.1 DUF433 domain-containing protein [Spirulina major CS-329]
MNYRDIITVEPQKRGGKPCVRGLRITVYLKMCKEDSHYKASPSRVTEGNGGRAF